MRVILSAVSDGATHADMELWGCLGDTRVHGGSMVGTWARHFFVLQRSPESRGSSSPGEWETRFTRRDMSDLGNAEAGGRRRDLGKQLEE